MSNKTFRLEFKPSPDGIYPPTPRIKICQFFTHKENGTPYLPIPEDCGDYWELEWWVNSFISDLEDIKRKARKKFKQHEEDALSLMKCYRQKKTMVVETE